MAAKSLPVLMHHYVSDYPNSIAVSPALFEEQCRVLAEHGWRGVGLPEAEEFLIRGAPLPAKSCLFTFDDGYLDNYVYAWPILRKYGHKAVIFVAAERIAEASASAAALRPTLDDVWSGRIQAADLPDVNAPMRDAGLGYAVRRDLFFTWDEARAMQASGVISIAAHSLRHVRVIKGTEYQDFVQPGEMKRTFYHTWPESFWGLPLFKYQSELAGPAFLPAPALTQAIQDLVPQDDPGALAFFHDQSKVDRLRALVEGFKNNLGRYESEAEQKERIYKLMEKNQTVLAQELGRPVRSFCWPWGTSCELALTAGRAAGFEVFYRAEPGVNPPGRPLDVGRFKVRNLPGPWLLSRVRLYSRPWLGRLYSALRM